MQIIISLDLFPFMSSALFYATTLLTHIYSSANQNSCWFIPISHQEQNSTTNNTSNDVDLCISVICINFMLVLLPLSMLLSRSHLLLSHSFMIPISERHTWIQQLSSTESPRHQAILHLICTHLNSKSLTFDFIYRLLKSLWNVIVLIDLNHHAQTRREQKFALVSVSLHMYSHIYSRRTTNLAEYERRNIHSFIRFRFEIINALTFQYIRVLSLLASQPKWSERRREREYVCSRI